MTLLSDEDRAEMKKWTDENCPEFTLIEDFDEFVKKWQQYMKLTNKAIDTEWGRE